MKLYERPLIVRLYDEIKQAADRAMKFVVIGGGIAGVCCAEELCRLNPNEHITLISADSVLKVHSLWLHRRHCDLCCTAWL